MNPTPVRIVLTTPSPKKMLWTSFLTITGMFTKPWVLMLLLGNLHHMNGWPINQSYWTCFIIVWACHILIPTASNYETRMLRRELGSEA